MGKFFPITNNGEIFYHFYFFSLLVWTCRTAKVKKAPLLLAVIFLLTCVTNPKVAQARIITLQIVILHLVTEIIVETTTEEGAVVQVDIVVVRVAVARAATHLVTTGIFREIIEDMMIDRHTQTARATSRGILGGMKDNFLAYILVNLSQLHPGRLIFIEDEHFLITGRENGAAYQIS